jgi:hypothetical protein
MIITALTDLSICRLKGLLMPETPNCMKGANNVGNINNPR